MKTTDIAKIRKSLEKELDNKRYEHTLAVAYTATSLAMRYNCNLNNALVAGLLHDCAKCISDSKKISICEKHKIQISDVERRNPSLLHGKVGAFLAMEEYNVDNDDIINAISFHTTGRPGMSILEKIIFVADYIEPGRNKALNLNEIRSLAFRDLDKALLRILQDTLLYLENSEDEIDECTQLTYMYYKTKVGKES